MRIAFSSILSCAVAIGMFASTPVARADGIAVPGGACQLSVPTTSTGVRPKATGFRNESTTTSNFVICPVTAPVVGNNLFTDILAVVYSLDGKPRVVTCTAVVGVYDDPGFLPMYSSKSESVDSSDTPFGQQYHWTAVDFGGTAGQPITGSVLTSVTCNLPPQTAISFIQTLY